MSIRASAIIALIILESSVCAESPSIAISKDRIDFKFGTRDFAKYHSATSQVKPYLWPIHAPNGIPVTRGWPLEAAQPGGTIDHIHQKSGWFTYGDVVPHGVTFAPKKKGQDGIDFWSEVPLYGRIVCVDVRSLAAGLVVVGNEWRTLDGVPVLHESSVMSVHGIGDGWLLSIGLHLRALGDGVTFGDTKEGAFGVRVHDQLRTEFEKGKKAPEVNRITNSNGQIGDKECWGRQADWCDYSGEIDGKAVGIAIFDDSSNKQRACWHVRGYGLMAANPFGREKSGFPAMKGRTDVVKLEKGEELKLRYGIYTHAGDVKTGKVAEAFSRFVELGKK